MKKLQKGFTLIELMIVVAIIAILAAVAAPKFGQQLKKAQDAKAIEVVGTWRAALNLSYSDNAIYAVRFGDLKSSVDAGTIAKTFNEVGMTTAVADAAVKAYVKAGTSTLGQSALFEFSTAAAKEAADAALVTANAMPQTNAAEITARNTAIAAANALIAAQLTTPDQAISFSTTNGNNTKGDAWSGL